MVSFLLRERERERKRERKERKRDRQSDGESRERERKERECVCAMTACIHPWPASYHDTSKTEGTCTTKWTSSSMRRAIAANLLLCANLN